MGFIQRRHSFVQLILIALAVILQGCTLSPERSLPVELQASPFIAPTQAATHPAQTVTAPTESAQPTPTIPCQDNLTFTTDLTIPDDSVVKPGATLDKRWEVRNSGSCNWDERYSLRRVAGDTLTSKDQLPLYPARSGVSLVIRIEFQAPMQPGGYRSAWQAYDPAGEPFGDPIYIAIIVQD